MPLSVGAPAPSCLLPRLGGGNLRLPPGPVLLFFFKVDCPTCPVAAPAVARIAQALVPGGLAVIGVSQDDDRDTAAFAAQNDLGPIELCRDLPSYPASSGFELRTVPTTFLVDEGKIAACVEGWSRDDYNALAVAAAARIGAQAPTASPAGDGLPDFRPG